MSQPHLRERRDVLLLLGASVHPGRGRDRHEGLSSEVFLGAYDGVLGALKSPSSESSMSNLVMGEALAKTSLE